MNLLFDLVYTVQVHRHAPPPRARARLYDFYLVEFSHQPLPFPVKQRVETTG